MVASDSVLWGKPMRNVQSIVLAGLFLSTTTLGGCASADFFRSTTGASLPGPGEERDYAVETLSGAQAPGPQGGGGTMSPGAYIVATVVHTNQKCTAFFDELEKVQQDSEWLNKVLTAGAAAGSPLVALVGATGFQVANFTSALSFTNQLNQYSADVYAFRTYSQSLKKHVFDGMSAYQRSRGIDIYFEILVGVREESTFSAVSANDQNPRLDSQALNLAGSGDIVVTLPDGPDPQDPKKTRFRRVTVDKGLLNEFGDPVGQLDKSSNAAKLLPARLLLARNIGNEYASLCSLATMRDIVTGALAASQTVVKPSSSGAPATTDTVPKTAASTGM